MTSLSGGTFQIKETEKLQIPIFPQALDILMCSNPLNGFVLHDLGRGVSDVPPRVLKPCPFIFSCCFIFLVVGLFMNLIPRLKKAMRNWAI